MPENFFPSLKTKLVYHRRHQNRAQAKHAIFEYRSLYNRECWHYAKPCIACWL
ncbi:IS3 family transposase [Candidatus Methylobacter favarea]|uniref:IS3 family transposase n=1 Tax=Candidatus Methylobacter favarea TaxID=2707345 RepID=UPI00157C641C